MDEEKSQKTTPKDDEPSRLVTETAEKVEQAKEEAGSRYTNSSQSQPYLWGLSWYEFLTVTTVTILGFGTIVATGLQWHAETIWQSYSQQKERARVVASFWQEKSTAPLSFSLTFKNVGETTALNTYGAWLQGECQENLPECVSWCIRPLKEQRGKSYGHLAPQEERAEEFFHTFKVGKSSQKQASVYFCGYVAYTDVFCVWHRKFHSFAYDPEIKEMRFHVLSNDEEEAQVQDCRP